VSSFLSHHASDKKKENISLSLERSAQSSGEVREWWVVNQSEPGAIKKKTNMTGLDLYIFSDQVSPPSLGFLAGYG
jgi:hypothetical protein